MPSATVVRPVLLAAAGSHPGLQRENNEDRYHCDPRRGLFMVIDGVGGQAAGEKASATALAMLRARLERETGMPADRIREAITLANNEIVRLAATEPRWAGMACVLTVALVRDGLVTIGHVGDTRLYAFRSGVLSKVTHDHSPVGTREDQGEIGELEAMRHPRRNEIYRDVGSDHHEPADDGFIEVVEFPFDAETALVLCTDGLSDMIPSTQLAAIVCEHASDPAVVVERLIEAANEAGGKDNVTAVFVAGEGFADLARQIAPARPSGWTAAAARASVLARRAGRRLLTRPAMLVYGFAAGLAVALALMLFTTVVPDRLLHVSPPVSWSRTWHVGPPDADFATIHEALASARPGDTVEVDPGTYDLPIGVPRDVSLVSRRSREAVLRFPPGLGRSPAVSLSGHSRLAGFRIEAPGTAVSTEGSDEVVLDDLEVVGAECGVAFGPGSRGTLRGSYIHDVTEVAVVVTPPALPSLLHNLITGNGRNPPARIPLPEGTGPWPAAIWLRDGASAVLFGNIIAGNAHDEIRGLAADKKAEVARDNVIGLPAAQRGGTGRPPAGRGGTPAGRGGTPAGRPGR